MIYDILWCAALVGGFLCLLVLPAFAVEWWQAREMRQRERQRESFRRYCRLVDEQAARLEQGCFYHREGIEE